MKYNNKTEFYLNCLSAYSSARKNKWIDDICSHMKKLKKVNGYWTYEKCKEASLECKTKMDLYKKYRGVYTVINKYKWFELMIHFEKLRISKKII